MPLLRVFNHEYCCVCWNAAEMPEVLIMLLGEVEQIIEDFDAGGKLMQEHVPLQLPR